VQGLGLRGYLSDLVAKQKIETRNIPSQQRPHIPLFWPTPAAKFDEIVARSWLWGYRDLGTVFVFLSKSVECFQIFWLNPGPGCLPLHPSRRDIEFAGVLLHAPGASLSGETRVHPSNGGIYTGDGHN